MFNGMTSEEILFNLIALVIGCVLSWIGVSWNGDRRIK